MANNHPTFKRACALCAAALSLLLLIAPATSSASQSCGPSPGGSPCGGAGPATLGNTSGTDQGTGNPIHLVSGNKYQREEDMPALPGILGLEIVRHYNSQYSLPNNPTGVLGRGWKLSYETDLFDTPVGVQVVQADGTRLIFAKDKSDPSHCAGANPAQGSITISQKRRGKEYLWRWQNGRELLFNAQGKLTQIAAPSGEFVRLQHDPQGWLIQVTDPQGRELHIQYLDRHSAQTTKTFRGVQSIDSPLGRYTYTYGSELPKTSSANPSLLIANLSQVSIPTWHEPHQRAQAGDNIGPSRSSITRHYHYANPQFPTLLTGISVQGTGAGSGSDGKPMHQRLSTYGYDSRAKAILSSKADGVDKITLDTSTPGQTVLTNSLGQTSTYRHANIAGEWRLLESRGAGCSSCSPANVRYAYDSLGRLIEQTQLDANGKGGRWRVRILGTVRGVSSCV